MRYKIRILLFLASIIACFNSTDTFAQSTHLWSIQQPSDLFFYSKYGARFDPSSTKLLAGFRQSFSDPYLSMLPVNSENPTPLWQESYPFSHTIQAFANANNADLFGLVETYSMGTLSGPFQIKIRLHNSNGNQANYVFPNTLPTMSGTAFSLHLSNDGQRLVVLVTTSSGTTIHVFNTVNLSSPLYSFQATGSFGTISGIPLDVKLTDDGGKLFFLGNSNFMIYDLGPSSSSIFFGMTNWDGTSGGIGISGDGNTFVRLTAFTKVEVFKRDFSVACPAPLCYKIAHTLNNSPVPGSNLYHLDSEMAFSSDGQTLVYSFVESTTNHHYLNVVDFASSAPVIRLNNHIIYSSFSTNALSSIELSRNKKKIAFGFKGSSTMGVLFSRADVNSNFSFDEALDIQGQVFDMKFSPNSRYLVVSNENFTTYPNSLVNGGQLNLYDLEGGTVSPPLNAPTNVFATDGQSSGIQVNFSPVSGSAVSYKIFRSVGCSGSPISVQAGTSFLESSSSNPNIIPGMIYSYSVQAFNSTSVSSCSLSNNGYQALGTSTLSVAIQLPNSAVLSWGEISGASDYQVFRSASCSGAAVATVTGLGFTDTNLALGSTYSYSMRARRTNPGQIVLGGCSNSVSMTVPPLGGTGEPPAPPSGLVASDGISMGGVFITFGAVNGATKYRIYRGACSGSWLTEVASPSFFDSTAAPGIAYTYFAQAVNQEGSSACGNSDTGYRQMDKPGSPTAALTSPTMVRLNWNSVNGAMAYQVYKSPGCSSNLLGTVSGMNSYTHIITAGDIFTYSVRAYSFDQGIFMLGACSDGFSINSGGSSTTPPAPPTQMAASDGLYSDRIEVRLTPPSPMPAGATFLIFRSRNCSPQSQIADTASTVINDRGTPAGWVTYYTAKTKTPDGLTSVCSRMDTGYKAHP